MKFENFLFVMIGSGEHFFERAERFPYWKDVPTHRIIGFQVDSDTSHLEDEDRWVRASDLVYRTLVSSPSDPRLKLVFVVEDNNQEFAAAVHVWITHLMTSLIQAIRWNIQFAVGAMENLSDLIMSVSSLIAVCGPSGSGKSTLVEGVLLKPLQTRALISCTTRKKRPGEVDGQHYHFLTDEEFDSQLDDMTQTATYGGCRYGSRKVDVVNIIADGVTPVAILSREGIIQFKNQMSCFSILVTAQKPLCEKRMLRRGDSHESIRKRLATWSEEVMFDPMFDLYFCPAEDLEGDIDAMISSFEDFGAATGG